MSDQRISYADLSGIERSLNHLSSSQDVLHVSVQQVTAEQAAARTELSLLKSTLDEFIRRDELAKNLQLAQTKIIDVRAQLSDGYGHFADVRRNATGTLQAIDAGIVLQSTIRQASEELMLNTPRYWLAPALVGLAAWIRDDRPLAERAVGEALRRDNDKTSLFFALVLRRQQRNSATARWIRQYVVRQDAARLSREFTVVLDAVATGALGMEAKPLVRSHMDAWHQRLCGDADIVEAQVDRWKQLIDGMHTAVDPGFTVLPKISPTWPRLRELYEGATVHGRAEEFFRELFHGPVQQSDDLRERVDRVLDGLVSNYDDEEAPLRREEAELQATIDNGGDRIAAAAAVAAKSAVYEDTIDFLTLLTNAAFFPEQVGASLGTQRLAIALARDWIVEADGRLEAANLAKLPTSVEIKVKGWKGHIDDTVTEKSLVTSFCRRIDQETQRAVADVRFTGGPLMAAFSVIPLVALALVLLAQGSTGAGLLFLVGGIVAGGWAFHEYQQLPQRRANVRAAGEKRKTAGVAQVRGAVAEVVDLRSQWEAEHAKATSFREFMLTLSSDGFGGSWPDQPREVKS